MVEVDKEAMKACGACKKQVTKVKRYYRNGRYYCNENCWKKAKQKAAEAAKAAAAE